jgi:hypothetical protein
LKFGYRVVSRTREDCVQLGVKRVIYAGVHLLQLAYYDFRLKQISIWILCLFCYHSLKHASCRIHLVVTWLVYCARGGCFVNKRYRFAVCTLNAVNGRSGFEFAVVYGNTQLFFITELFETFGYELFVYHAITSIRTCVMCFSTTGCRQERLQALFSRSLRIRICSNTCCIPSTKATAPSFVR